MHFLLQSLKVKDFDQILRAYKRAEISIGNAIDGGAGSGTTATKILNELSPQDKVFAFEPFNGNHRFFKGLDDRIILHKKALYERETTMNLSIPGVVEENSAWGKRGLTGYSSGGHLSENAPRNEYDMEVSCVAADPFLSNEDRIGFVKLDLQGGELAALRGMKNIMKDSFFAWVEYGPKMSTPDLLKELADQNFLLFDTEYIFRGNPNQTAKEIFEVTREGGALSSGTTVWRGFKKKPWGNYSREIFTYQEQLNLVQTDLFCLNRRFTEEFLQALPNIIQPSI